MPTFSQIETAIYGAINGLALVSDKHIEWQYQNHPHPGKPYFSLLMNSFGKIGADVFTVPDGSGDSDMVGNRQFTLMISGFGSGIVEATYKLQTQFENPVVHQLLRDGGIIPYDIDGTVQNISGLDESENEERSSYDVLFRTDSVITGIPLGYIQIVNAQGTYKQSGKGDKVKTFSVDST